MDLDRDHGQFHRAPRGSARLYRGTGWPAVRRCDFQRALPVLLRQAQIGAENEDRGQIQLYRLRVILDSYLELRWEEVHEFEMTPHPLEFKLYYSV